ncbi:hypothetical protein D3C85_835470 [compost metagenome]
MVTEYELRHGLEHGDVDRLANASALPVVERGAYRAHGAHADDAVGHRQRHVARHVGAGLHGQGRQRHGTLDQVVVCRLGGVGAALAVTVDADVDDLWVDRSYRRIVQLQSGHGLRADVVDQHVDVGGQFQQCLAALGLLEVKDDTALVAVGLHEYPGHTAVAARADITHGVTAGRFDLDDIGTQVTEHLRRVGPHQDGRDIEDAYTRQRTTHRDALHACVERAVGRSTGQGFMGTPRKVWMAP